MGRRWWIALGAAACSLGPTDPLAPARQACDEGEPAACVALADGLAARGPEALADAGRALRAACDLGRVKACARAGQTFAEAGVTAEALSAFTAACEGGEAEACHGGWVVATAAEPPDHAAGLALLEAGCGLGHDHACAMWVVSLRDGRGVEADGDRAMAVAAQGCAAELPQSCWLMVSMAAQDVAEPPESADLDAARALACDRGLFQACE